ncbi:hypothetical protein OsJ_27404 [Oryza sativa Japonica Group]|uniref:Uncharacterized protein n=1 Tax=Oryza sativa subsp. japonica TaxID=39947 RepID=B9G112_ORYSJ|nr:hypothetical protein OsJ_27404 [Oryza sativa Japonica Group]
MEAAEEGMDLDNDHQLKEHTLHVNANANEKQDDDDVLQHELQALEYDIQEYGVYADAINVVFNVDELLDSDEEENDANANEPIKSRKLTNPQRQGIYELLLAKIALMGLDIRFVNQPPNSPDMNCLDLGFFASLQSLTSTRVSSNMEELVENVHKEYNDYNPTTLNRVFVALQSCYIVVMKASRGNKYKIPHMNKESLEALGILPKALFCDHPLYERAIQLIVY